MDAIDDIFRLLADKDQMTEQQKHLHQHLADQQIIEDLRAQLAAQLAAEREACAKLVESKLAEDCDCGGVEWCELYGCSTLIEIAALIRERGRPA